MPSTSASRVETAKPFRSKKRRILFCLNISSNLYFFICLVNSNLTSLNENLHDRTNKISFGNTLYTNEVELDLLLHLNAVHHDQ